MRSEIKNSTSNEQLNQLKKPKAVIIVSSKRSGSSFVGEFFNRHPDVYYTFEPLHTVSDFASENRLSNKDFLKTSLSVINGSFYCDFQNNNIARFASEKFCVSNLKLYKKQLCRNGWTPPSEAKIRVWDNECRKYKMVVIKLIRINYLEDLRPLLSEIDLEWRIIYLVRDPRPTELSRKGSGRNYDLIRRKGTDRNDEVDLCETLQRNLKFWVDTPSWLQGRFRMIRFEDIAASPLEKAKELLEFVGLDLADDVANWIKENTEHEKRSSMKPREFSTSRNTSKVLEAWRLNMDWTLVQRVQKVCSVSMRSLGYALMSNLLSLRDLSIPSTLPLS
ncbi:Carbohydrate sulfotransferase 3 [Holothuria leucospilota]|uniref:Carbohydrate sulfotransferase 3 n=1 Tax=Holothuria leucospilota TaxID=206669 RepID=A0A9Q1BAB9_HOLLE|nr:Carbohydrate sulfotransferase 3 [Holothuria leucospilota]